MRRINSRRNNNAMYESIMHNVAKEVKMILESIDDEDLEDMVDDGYMEPRMSRRPMGRPMGRRNNVPMSKEELKAMVEERIRREGDDCDLNDIDVSNVEDLSEIFFGTNFCGDISSWNTSNATDMNHMFMGCADFDCDLSDWDVSNVRDMECTFAGCRNFNCDLSNWDTASCTCNRYCFYECGMDEENKPMFPAVNETRIFPHRGMKSLNESRRMPRRRNMRSIGYRRY